jgi:predicted phosphoribosyltransferase/predicted alpha/beta-hydrolase family hydrolase
MAMRSGADIMVSLPFRDRDDAAQQLHAALAKYRDSKPVVLAIPRGAVPMGRIVADALGGELDVVFVRKLGAPGNPEYAIGAVDEQGAVTLNEQARWAGADDAYIQHEVRQQLALIHARRAYYRPNRAAVACVGRTVIVLDDGLATGSTMIAALKAVRAQAPKLLVCAVPVAARESLAQVARYADEVVCLATPSPFHAVGQYYFDFDNVGDEQVIDALAAPGAHRTEEWLASDTQVRIPAGQVVLEGDLLFPQSPRGLVIFAHGSGSSRHSTRNRFVATTLNRRGFATLLFDLLTPQEDRDPATRFNIPLLAQRLQAALEWALQEPSRHELPIGLFGASTGAAAAIMVAAARPKDVAAVVSRGGRPDLAGLQALPKVRTHTLLIVGSADWEVLELNRAAAEQMGEWAEIALVSGATHLFEEPGTLEQAATLAADWFTRWL